MATLFHRRPVLCGIDNSDVSSATARLAGALVRRLGCRLVLVYVAETEESFAQAAGDLSNLREAALEAGRCAFEPIVRKHGLAAELQVEIGNPAARLISAAAKHDAQLLLVGSRGRRRFMRGLLGSTSTKIARHAPCPVVVVSAKAASKSERFSDKRRKPLVLCGLDENHGFRTLLLAIDLSRRLGARLMIGHAHDDPSPIAPTIAPGEMEMEMDTDQLIEARREHGRDLVERAAVIARDQSLSNVETRLLAGDPALSLNALADREAADLIVVGSRGRGSIRSILLGSVCSALAGTATTPVAILPAGARIAPRSGHYEVAIGPRSERPVEVGRLR